MGDPLLAETEVGRVIVPARRAGVSGWIEEAVARAQSIGGGRLSDTTVMPAILVEPAADANVSQLEIFGPVTCVPNWLSARPGALARRVRAGCHAVAQLRGLRGGARRLYGCDHRERRTRRDGGANGEVFVLAVTRASEIIGIICAGSSSP